MTLAAVRIERPSGKVYFRGLQPEETFTGRDVSRVKCVCGLEVEIGRTTFDGDDVAYLVHPDPACAALGEKTIEEIRNGEVRR
jgi:hypothetical protein